jgi:hypothetical protein
MDHARRDVDVLLAVPFEPLTAYGIDPTVRQTLGSYLGHPLAQAVAEFERFVGHSLNTLEWTDHPLLHGQGTALRSDRTLTAVALATHLEKHGLCWEVIDPGVQELRYWRRCFARRRPNPPRVIAISTTFVSSQPWLTALCSLVRKTLPESKIVVGGTFYLSSMRQFLSLDADVFCFGEGEIRLPQLVKAIRDGEALDSIPGLCLRSTDGSLRHTGPVAPLKLNELDPVDWRLVNRIEPAVDLEADPCFYSVETQRGCAFRCAFCTYRTLTCHEAMSPEDAVGAILNTEHLPPGYLFIVDSTAAFPHKRWQRILELLVQQGGSPHPMVAFARVSDVSETAAELMSRAGVRGVIVGQESGDQGLLNAMRKGTKVEQVRPAVAALGKYGVGAQFAFIHGFPGENSQSIQATRSMIVGLNDGFESDPVVPAYNLTPFSLYDFASVAHQGEIESVRHYLGYDCAEFPPKRVAEEMLATLIAGSRVPHAPLCSFLFNGLADFLFNIPSKERCLDIFRWLKAYERGVAIYLERDLEGTKPQRNELKQLRSEVLARLPAHSRWKAPATRVMLGARIRSSRRMQAEWSAEKNKGPGMLTRSYVAVSRYRDFGRLDDAVGAWKAGTYASNGAPHDPETVDKMAADLVGQALR